MLCAIYTDVDMIVWKRLRVEKEKVIDCVVLFESIYLLLARNEGAAMLYKWFCIERWYNKYDTKLMVSAVMCLKDVRYKLVRQIIVGVKV